MEQSPIPPPVVAATPPTTAPIMVEGIQRCYRSLRRNFVIELIKGAISFCVRTELVGAIHFLNSL